MISVNNMAQLILDFRKVCLELHPSDIDLLPKDKRSQRLGIENTDGPNEMLLNNELSLTIENICFLSKTPRLIKYIFRHTFIIWDNLHGEIDFDDVLVLTTLRYAAPEAYSFIIDNINEIRNIKKPGAIKENENRLNEIENKWSECIISVNWNKLSAKNLIHFLFPSSWPESQYEKTVPSLQGVQASNPTDYFLRYRLEAIHHDEIRDQEIISIYSNWEQDADDKLVSEIATSREFAERFEYLITYQDGFFVRKVASKVFEYALSVFGVTACSDSVYGFIPLWRSAIRKPFEETKHHNWIREEIFKALKKSLRFANDLYYYWRSKDENSVRSRLPTLELRKQIITRAKEVFQNNPDEYIKVIDPSFMYSSYHFCVHHSSKEQGENGFNPTEWTWFADLLIDAGEINPQVLIPQIACMVVKETMQFADFSYNFELSEAKEMFGEKIERVMGILSNKIDTDKFDTREKKRIQTAHEYSIDHLKQKAIDNK